MLYFFIGLSVMLSVAVFHLTRSLLRLNDAVTELEEQVEESLDIIDARFSRITDISKLPVAFDDPTVKDLLNEINLSRESLLLIANKIASFSGEDKDD